MSAIKAAVVAINADGELIVIDSKGRLWSRKQETYDWSLVLLPEEPKSDENITKGTEFDAKEYVFEFMAGTNSRIAIDSWHQYCDYRRIEKKQKLTERAARRQLKEMARHSIPEQVRAVEQSMRQGYQGLFFKGDKHATSSGVSKTELGDPEAKF